MNREYYERELRKRHRRAKLTSGRYMTLSKFLIIQVIILIGTLTMTVITRQVQTMQVDFNDFVREEVKEQYEFVGVPNYNEWVTEGIWQPTELDKKNIVDQYRSKHYNVDKDIELGIKLAGFNYDLGTLTYDDIFYEDPQEYADVYFVFIFVVYGLVIEIVVLNMLNKQGMLEWYSERDMSYWI